MLRSYFFFTLFLAVLAVAASGAVATPAAATDQAPQPAQAEKIGAGVTDRAATTIADLYAKPEAFLGKTVRVEGVVTAVCTDMGCWMALAQENKPEETVRFKVDDDAGIVFPMTAIGRGATAEGVFEKIDPAEAEAHGAEHDATAQATGFDALYQVKATGAVIR
jgi:hypothetical protein